MSKVIVVGGGLSGLSAAHTLYERGANVLVLDKNPFFGGNSTKATSGINGAGTRGQADLGIPDTAKQFEADTTKSARDLARPDLIKVLTYQSGAAVNWLVDRFGLDLTKVSRLGGHSQPRTHRGGAQFPGMTITYAQMEKLEDLAESDPDRVKIIRKARVTQLIKENNQVVGVEYTHNGQTSKEYGPVILATGGYAADFDESENGLLKKYRPELLKLSTTNGDHCTGDGQKMIAAIGGKLIDLEKVQVHPTGLVDPRDPDAKVKFLAAEALRGVGGILLDNEGNRFADELGHRDYVTGRMWDNNKFPVRLILNSKSGKEIEWHCKHYAGRGLMKHFESGAALAKEMGIPESKLEATFANYRAIAKGDEKDPFGKKFFQHPENFKMDDQFWVAHMQPVLHYTMGGARIDPQSRVLDQNEKPIPGLFACGELGGGVHGANRLGGSSLLGCVVYGRVAGDSAAAYLLNGISTGKIASARAGQVQQHLETRVRVDPSNSSLNLSFHWAGEGASSGAAVQQQSAGPLNSETSAQAATTSTAPAPEQKQAASTEQKEYSLDEVAKHDKESDIWIAVNGQVLDVTSFLQDHPGGAKALLLYAGKEASEEFNMLHEKSVIGRYAPHTVVGTYKQ